MHSLPAWLALALACVAIYHPVTGHEFVNFDDPMFLTDNSHVRAGFTVEGLRWAWTNKDAVLWQPLAWMGHMLVADVAGMNPVAHLWSNLLMHMMNAGLLFTLLRRLTAKPGRSFAVALLFAVHPVNVETVAWASQLKSTLSTCFFLVGLLLYVRPPESRRLIHPGALAAFALSLLAKPMLLFFPLLLVLLDFWPERRLPPAADAVRRRDWIAEKIPYVVLAGVLLAMTVVPWATPVAADMAQMQAPGWQRLMAVPCNYVSYLGMMFAPVDLAVLYPETLAPGVLSVIGAVLILGAVSGLVWSARRRIPALLFGWCWFLVSMIPASGLLRAGQHAVADRYFYVPGIGLFIALVWASADLLEIRGARLRPALLAIVTLALGWRSHGQVAVWASSLSLWEHAAAVTPPNRVRHVNLGNALMTAGRHREAESEFQAAMTLEPGDPRPYTNLAIIAQLQGDIPRAIELNRRALTLSPTDARISSNLGSLLDDQGDNAEARQLLETAVRLRPDLAEAQVNLGVHLARAGELARAQACFEAAVRLKPDDQAIRHNLRLVQTERAARGAD